MHGCTGGGMRGFIWGACVVLFGGCAWFYLGGIRGFIRGACVVLFGGVCVVLFGGVCGFIRGACVVLFGGHAWFYSAGGGVHGFFCFSGYNEIRSMSGRYASYWNAFLLYYGFTYHSLKPFKLKSFSFLLICRLTCGLTDFLN